MGTFSPVQGFHPNGGRGRDPHRCPCLLPESGTQLGQYGCPILPLYARNRHLGQDGRVIFVAGCIIKIAAAEHLTTHYFTIMTEMVPL